MPPAILLWVTGDTNTRILSQKYCIKPEENPAQIESGSSLLVISILLLISFSGYKVKRSREKREK